MPWTLKPPHTRKDGKTIEFYYVRGKYLGIRLDRSTGTGEADAAKRILATWKRQAERGEFSSGPAVQQPERPTFVKAAIAYMQSGGSGEYLDPIIKAWATKLLDDVDQIALDTLAVELYPKGSPATRARQVYTPVAAVLHRVGVERKFKRPKGSAGKKSTSWLEPEQAFALFEATDAVDLELGLLCRHLTYTGMRIDEALTRKLRDLKLDRAFIYLDDSKTGDPRGCHLPPMLVEAYLAQPPRAVTPVVRDKHGHFLSGKPLDDAGVPFLERRPEAKLFRFHDGGALRAMLKKAMTKARLSFPRREGGFHIFCHTYGSWMHRFGGLDRYGLTRTGRWADAASADRYVHTAQSEEARRADLLPRPKRGQVVDMKKGVA